MPTADQNEERTERRDSLTKLFVAPSTLLYNIDSHEPPQDLLDTHSIYQKYEIAHADAGGITQSFPLVNHTTSAIRTESDAFSFLDANQEALARYLETRYPRSFPPGAFMRLIELEQAGVVDTDEDVRNEAEGNSSRFQIESVGDHIDQTSSSDEGHPLQFQKLGSDIKGEGSGYDQARNASRNKRQRDRSAGVTTSCIQASRTSTRATTVPVDTSDIPYPAPAALVAYSHDESPRRAWHLWEEEIFIKHMLDVMQEATIANIEARFDESLQRARHDGLQRSLNGAMSHWKRRMRQRSGLDERRPENQTQVKSTSLQTPKKGGKYVPTVMDSGSCDSSITVSVSREVSGSQTPSSSPTRRPPGQSNVCL